MAGWSTRIRFGRAHETPLAVVRRTAELCAEGFRVAYVCPLGWQSFATSRARRESEGFFALLDREESLIGKGHRSLLERAGVILGDPTFGGLMVSYDWPVYARVLGDESRMYAPSFHWEVWPEDSGTGVALKVEHAMSHLSRTPAWQAWFSAFVERAAALLAEGRWAVDDDEDDYVYAALEALTG